MVPACTVDEAILTMLPEPWRCIWGRMARQQRNGPRTLTAITLSQRSGSTSKKLRFGSRAEKRAALLISPSIRPYRPTHSSANRLVSLSDDTSATTGCTSPPADPTSSARAWSGSAAISDMTSRAPSLAKSRAYTAPIPCAAPVKTITLPARLAAIVVPPDPIQLMPVDCPRPVPGVRTNADHAPPSLTRRFSSVTR